MSIAYIGLGSNLGDRAGNIGQAIGLLQKKGIKVLKTSAVIETAPVGGPPQNKFLNADGKVATRLSPVELLEHCRFVEQKLGRVRTVINGPRTMDLDILLYDRLTIDTPQLQIPHPRMFERAFVLDPLREIEPGLLEEFGYARHKVH